MKRILMLLPRLPDLRGTVLAWVTFSPSARGTGVRHIADGRRGRLSMKAAAAWALLALGGLDWIWAYYAGLTFTHWQVIVLVMALLLALGVFYSASGRSGQLADIAHYAALYLAFMVTGTIFTYLTASLRLPLWDAELASIDSALGFNWLAWFQFVEAHRMLKLLLVVAYGTLTLQVIGSIIYFSHVGRRDRNDELWWCAMVSLLITAVMSGIFPAIGAFVTYGVPAHAQATHLPHLLALRDGSISSFALDTMQGIITMPSYHTVLAILLIYVHRGQRVWFPAVAVINGLMLVSVPSEGGHYLVDMLAGGAVAALSVMALRAAMRVGHLPGPQSVSLGRSVAQARPEEGTENKSNLA